jgi:putative oxidoreductase
MDFLTKYSSQLLGITRIVIGLLFLEHGTAKVLSFPLAAGAAPHAFNLMSFPVGPAGIIELVAGALIVLGFFSRWAAFIASGEMAFAYFMGHFGRSPFPLLNGGGEAICFCFIFLYLAAAGPGAFAINKK